MSVKLSSVLFLDIMWKEEQYYSQVWQNLSLHPASEKGLHEVP